MSPAEVSAGLGRGRFIVKPPFHLRGQFLVAKKEKGWAALVPWYLRRDKVPPRYHGMEC